MLRRNGIEVQRTTEGLGTANLEPIGVGVLPATVKPGNYRSSAGSASWRAGRSPAPKEAKMGSKPSYDVTG